MLLALLVLYPLIDTLLLSPSETVDVLIHFWTYISLFAIVNVLFWKEEEQEAEEHDPLVAQKRFSGGYPLLRPLAG
jgi:uncharacterized sodium:solute symporter family permease YidK